MSSQLTCCFYKDVHKSTSDVFSQGYVGKGSLKFSTETKAGDFAVKTATGRAFVKDRKTGNLKEQVSGVVEPTFEWKEHNLKVDGKFSTLAEFTGTISCKPGFLPDSKASLGLNFATTDKKETRVAILPGFDYQHQKFALQFASQLSQSSRPHLATVNVNIQPVDQVYVGGTATAKISEGSPKLKSAEAKIAGSFSDVAVSVGGSYEKCTKGAKKGYHTPRVNYGLLYHHCDSFSLASQGNWDTSGSGGAGPTVSLGAVYKADPNLSFSAKTELGFKSKDEDGKKKDTGVRLGVGATTKLNSNVSATAGVDINVRSLFADAEADHTCGIEFKFKQ